MEQEGVNAKQLAERAGLPSPNAIYNFLNGHSGDLHYKTLEKISPVLNVPVESFWKAKPASDAVTQPKRESDLPYPLNVHDTIPLYGPASAGIDVVYLTGDNVIGEEPRPPALQGVKGGFMILVAGDCMEPRHFHGEKVWVHPFKRPVVNDDCLIVMEPDGNAQVKRYMGETAKEIRLMQWNPKKEISVSKKDVRKIYAIVR